MWLDRLPWRHPAHGYLRQRHFDPYALARQWGSGSRSRSCGRAKCEWLYVCGLVRPATGPLFAPTLSRVRVAHLAEALEGFAAHADPGGKKVPVLVVDNAGRHRAKRLAVPTNVRLHVRPPCAPERQPVEPFWPLVREAVADDTFARLSDPRRRVTRRCQRRAADQATVKRAIGFHRAVNLEK